MYVYCRDCGWQQDDFWTWEWTIRFWKYRAFGYNPFQCIIDTIREWIFPRYITVQKASGEITRKFSWIILVEELFEILKNAATTKWKTYKQFQNDPNKYCPVCGSVHLSID